jgi:NADH-quinone oxidoreductase subunit J
VTALATVLLWATATHPTLVDAGTFSVSAALVIAGAIGVIVARNPVHSALMLIMTLFGVAVLFLLLQDPFLAVVQVIVYAGAIVVMFLFVIMFLGVDREENLGAEKLRGQRPTSVILAAASLAGLLILGFVGHWTLGAPHVAGPDTGAPNVNLLGQSLFTTYLFPFEATAALLIIAVVGAVALARRPGGEQKVVDAAPGPLAPELDPASRFVVTPPAPGGNEDAEPSGPGNQNGGDGS